METKKYLTEENYEKRQKEIKNYCFNNINNCYFNWW